MGGDVAAIGEAARVVAHAADGDIGAEREAEPAAGAPVVDQRELRAGAAVGFAQLRRRPLAIVASGVGRIGEQAAAEIDGDDVDDDADEGEGRGGRWRSAIETAANGRRARRRRAGRRTASRCRTNGRWRSGRAEAGRRTRAAAARRARAGIFPASRRDCASRGPRPPRSATISRASPGRPARTDRRRLFSTPGRRATSRLATRPDWKAKEIQPCSAFQTSAGEKQTRASAAPR